MATERDPEALFTRGRPFSPGNPGRPKGARNWRTVLVEKLMLDDAKEIATAIIGAAKGGDPTAMRLCIERIAPVRKGRAVAFALSKIDDAADIGTALSEVIALMAAGELSPEEASSVAGVIEAKRKSIELSELERRVAALEKEQGNEPENTSRETGELRA